MRSPLWQVTSRGAAFLQNDGLEDRELLDRIPPVFPPKTTLTHAANRNLRWNIEKCIEPNDARPDASGDANRRVDIARPDARREAVLGVIGEANDFLDVVEGYDRHHGAECFLSCKRRRQGDVGENGRLKE